MSDRGDAKKGAEIQSLVRASALLREIARNRDGIGLAQLSRTLDLHTSTAFHLLKTLANLGYVRQDETTKLYRVGSQIFNLAATASDEVEIAKLAEPFIDELAMRTGETSHLALRSGEEIVVVARSYGNTAFHFAERTGTTRPPHATAIGKALLAAMPQKNLEALVNKLELRAITPRTITDPQKLLEEMRSRKQEEIEALRKAGESDANSLLEDLRKALAASSAAASKAQQEADARLRAEQSAARTEATLAAERVAWATERAAASGMICQ